MDINFEIIGDVSQDPDGYFQAISDLVEDSDCYNGFQINFDGIFHWYEQDVKHGFYKDCRRLIDAKYKLVNAKEQERKIVVNFTK